MRPAAAALPAQATSSSSIQAPSSHFACRLELLPADTRHLVVCMTVPMVWPKLPFSEGVMSAVDGLPVLKKVMSKTGVGAGIVDK